MGLQRRAVLAAVVGATLALGTVSANAAPGVGRWFHAGSLPQRQNTDVAVTVAGGETLLIGGEVGAASTRITQGYYDTVNLWLPRADMTTDRFDPIAVTLRNGRVLVAGGTHFTAGQADLVARSSAEIYNPRQNTWTATGSMHVGRAGATATLLADGRVLVAGGYDENSALPDAEIYNPATGTWKTTGELRIARTGHVTTLLPGGDVLAVGGIALLSPTDSPVIGYVERWNHTTGKWSIDSALNTPRAYPMAATLPDGSFLVAGGYSDRSGTQRHVTATAERYLPASRTWVPAASMSVPRGFSAGAALPNGHVLVAGGVTNSKTTTFRAVASSELYDPVTDTWQSAVALPEPRFGAVGMLLPDNPRVLVASGLSSYLDLNSDPLATRDFDETG